MSPFEPVVFAFPVAALALALGWRPWRPQVATETGAGWSAAGLAACLLAGHVGLKGRLPHYPPLEAMDWVCWFTLLGALSCAAWIDRRVGGAPGRAALAGGLGLALAVGALSPLLERVSWPAAAGQVLACVALCVAVSVGLWARCARPGGSLPVCAGMLVAGSTAAVGLAHSYAGAALLCGSVTVLVGGCMVLGLWRSQRAGARGLALPWTLAVGGLLLAGVSYAELPAQAAVTCLLVPFGASLWDSALRSRCMALLLTLALAAIALWSAWPAAGPYQAYR